MKKRMKKISLILAVAIILTVLPLNVFASEDIEPVNVPYLGKIEIIAGEVQIDPESKLLEMVYDEDEYLEKVTNEEGYEFFFKYDEAGILGLIVDNKGNLAELKYNGSGERYKTNSSKN